MVREAMDFVKAYDPELGNMIEAEYKRQQRNIELIASENIVSEAVMAAMGSVLTNKYAEGYPGKRYYGGCECVDEVERLAIERVTRLFGADHANVQPHSGSQANMAVYAALLQPGDRILGMNLSHGGHLTHGSKASLSGKYFEAHFYGVDPETETIDYEALARTAEEVRPKLIIAGASAYPRVIDFARFREVADSVGAYLMVDMAHIGGLVAAGVHPSPVPYADVVTCTTHKTLRGPRGAIILCRDELAKKIDSAVFPGTQGGPLMHVIAGKAVCFGEALQPAFRTYQQQVVKNAAVLVHKDGKALCLYTQHQRARPRLVERIVDPPELKDHLGVHLADSSQRDLFLLFDCKRRHNALEACHLRLHVGKADVARLIAVRALGHQLDALRLLALELLRAGNGNQCRLYHAIPPMQAQ